MEKNLHRKIEMNNPEKENMKRMVELFLKMAFIGFDELKMNEREEVIDLFGERLKSGIENFDRRLSILEEKIQSLEN